MIGRRAGSHPYDVVIIGSGIGGLTAGAYLGKHGVKVKMYDKPTALKLLADYLQLAGSGSADDTGSQSVFVAPEMASEESWKNLTSKS